MENGNDVAERKSKGCAAGGVGIERNPIPANSGISGRFEGKYDEQ